MDNEKDKVIFKGHAVIHEYLSSDDECKNKSNKAGGCGGYGYIKMTEGKEGTLPPSEAPSPFSDDRIVKLEDKIDRLSEAFDIMKFFMEKTVKLEKTIYYLGIGCSLSFIFIFLLIGHIAHWI